MKSGDIEIAVTLSEEEAISGTTKKIEYERLMICKRCKGKTAENCQDCNSVGLIMDKFIVKVKFKPNTSNSDVYRLRGAGNQNPIVKSGDLLVNVETPVSAYQTRKPFTHKFMEEMKEFENTRTSFYMPVKKGFFGSKKFSDWVVCHNCKSMLPCHSIPCSWKLIGRRAGVKAVDSSNSATFMSYNQGSGFSPGFANIQSTQHVGQDYGKYDVKFVCPECNRDIVVEREVEINVWIDEKKKEQIEIKQSRKLRNVPIAGQIKINRDPSVGQKITNLTKI